MVNRKFGAKREKGTAEKWQEKWNRKSLLANTQKPFGAAKMRISWTVYISRQIDENVMRWANSTRLHQKLHTNTWFFAENGTNKLFSKIYEHRNANQFSNIFCSFPLLLLNIHFSDALAFSQFPSTFWFRYRKSFHIFSLTMTAGYSAIWRVA